MDNQKIIDTLALLLKEHESGSKYEKSKQLSDKLLSFFKTKLIPKLNDLDMLGKSSSINSFMKLYEHIDFFLDTPELLGKSIIGVFPDKRNYLFKFENVLYDSNTNFLRTNKNIITIISKEYTKNVHLINKLGSFVDINRNDYEVISSLHKNKININDLINFYMAPAQNDWDNVVFIIFPYYADLNSGFFKLIDILDGAIVFDSDYNKKFDYLTKVAHNTILYNEFTDIKVIEFNNVKCRYCNFDETRTWLDMQNKQRFNFSCCIETKMLVYSIINRLKVIRKKESDFLNNITENIVFVENDDALKDYLGKLRDKSNDEIVQLDKSISALNSIYTELFKLLNEIEDYLEDSNNSSIAIREDFVELLVSAAITFSQNKDSLEYNKVMGILRRTIPQYSYLVNLYFNINNPSINDLRLLKDETLDINVVRHLKFKLAKKINLNSKYDLFKLLSPISFEELSGDEIVFLGDYYCDSINNKVEAADYYISAIKKGNCERAEKLLKLYNENELNDTMLRDWAETFEPIGAYEYSKFLLSNSRGVKRGELWTRIAACCGNLDAVLDIARTYSEKAGRNSFYFNASKHLFNYLISEGFKVNECNESLGMLYFNNKYYQLAYKCLYDANTAHSIFLCAKMKANIEKTYEGIGQDLDEASRLVDLSISLGSYAAYDLKYSIAKLIEEKNKKANEERKRKRYESHEDEECESSCCFVIAATCISLGLVSSTAKAQEIQSMYNNHIYGTCRTVNADTFAVGKMLMLYHRYRDNCLLKENNGNDLLKEYYRVSNKLINTIGSSQQAYKVYKSAYDEVIVPSMVNIKQGNYVSADSSIIKMMLKLCKEYGIIVNSKVLRYILKTKGISG